MTLSVIRGSTVPPLPAATSVGTAALREEVICPSHQRVCGQAGGTQTPSEAQASGTDRSLGRSQPLPPLTRLRTPALLPPAGRPHPPAWRRPSLRPGAASPAGPGAAGAAWQWPRDVCPAGRREQAGNFATGPAVRLPRTGPAPGAVSRRALPFPSARRPPRGRFSSRPAPTEASPSPGSSRGPVPGAPGSSRRRPPPCLLKAASHGGEAEGGQDTHFYSLDCAPGHGILTASLSFLT